MSDDEDQSEFTAFDFHIARKMWEADQRPCGWNDLDMGEKVEWAIMAGAARKTVVQHLAQHVRQSEMPRLLAKDEIAIVQDLARRLAVTAIRNFTEHSK